MMSKLLRASLLLAIVACVFPGLAEAGVLRCLFHHHGGHHSCLFGHGRHGHGLCQVCQYPPQHCTCTTLTPIVETHYQRQNCVTYRNVPEIRYRKEQCVTKVPVTSYHDVTVDAGCYQTVWVPKLITRKVPQTTYENRVSERVVPYQVNRIVPFVTSRLVPRQTIRYVPQTSCSPILSTTPMTSNLYSQPAPVTGLSQSSIQDSYDGSPSTASNRSGLFVPVPSAATVWHSRNGFTRR